MGLFSHIRGNTRQIAEGIREYMLAHPRWEIVPAYYLKAARHVAKGWPLDGILYEGDNPWRRVLKDIHLPMVNLSYGASSLGWPNVMVDDVEIGQLAAEHLLQRRYRHYGFVGYSDQEYSKTRLAEFARRVGAAGHEVSSFTKPFVRQASWAGDALRRWIARLPKPAGVFLCHDMLGLRAIEACRQAEVSIPREVGLLGVDNVVYECELIRPTLSSICYPFEQVGFQAAQMLDRMMHGAAPPNESLKISPTGVAARTSTDIYHYGDDEVAAAMEFIRDHVHEPISVDDLLDHLAISRSRLERRFRKVLNSTPLREMKHARIRQAQDMLTQTALSTAQIAERSGFRHTSHFSAMFKKLTGQTPSAYRRENRPAMS